MEMAKKMNLISSKTATKKIVIFFWIAVLSLSLFLHRHQLVKEDLLFLSSRYKRVIISKVEIKDERWGFSWTDQIVHFIVIFIIFSFLITVIAKKYNDYAYPYVQVREGIVRFLTRLYHKNISPFKVKPLEKDNGFEMYKILNGGGRKRNLFGLQEKCFFIEYVIYFQFFYNFLFFVFDLLIFPMIRAFFRKKKKENLMDCVGHIIDSKFYLSEDGLELISMFYISPMATYVLYRFLCLLVIRIYLIFDQTLAEEMMEMADEEGKKIIIENEKMRLKDEREQQEKQKAMVTSKKVPQLKHLQPKGDEDPQPTQP